MEKSRNRGKETLFIHPCRVLLIGLPLIQWCELYLLRQPVCDLEIIVAFDKYKTHNEHGIVRRRNLRHSLRHASFPSRPANEVIASPGSRGAFADVGKISAVRRISELHAVVAASHVRHVQHVRPFGEVEPAADVEHVVGPCS
ncbi:MAG TPA: hypothetical protein VFV38_06660 [Ktedonobacteraceae bacterium]|nr:hypothetical protein [Ktedonobacteraceae bacterium]